MRTLKSKPNALAVMGAAAILCGAPALAQPEGEEATRSALINPATAMAYSMVLPGYGQIYAGEPVRGGVLLALDAGLTGTAVAGYFLKNDTLMQGAIVGMIVTTVVATFDAYLLARDRNRERVETARQLKGIPLPQ